MLKIHYIFAFTCNFYDLFCLITACFSDLVEMTVFESFNPRVYLSRLSAFCCRAAAYIRQHYSKQVQKSLTTKPEVMFVQLYVPIGSCLVCLLHTAKQVLQKGQGEKVKNTRFYKTHFPSVSNRRFTTVFCINVNVASVVVYLSKARD